MFLSKWGHEAGQVTNIMNTMKVGCSVGAKHKICVMYTDAAASLTPV